MAIDNMQESAIVNFANCQLPIANCQLSIAYFKFRYNRTDQKNMSLQIKKLFLTGLLVSATSFLFSQSIDAIINSSEVERIQKILSSDDMRGRGPLYPI